MNHVGQVLSQFVLVDNNATEFLPPHNSIRACFSRRSAGPHRRTDPLSRNGGKGGKRMPFSCRPHRVAHIPAAIQLGEAGPLHSRLQPFAAGELPHVVSDQDNGGLPASPAITGLNGVEEGRVAQCRSWMLPFRKLSCWRMARPRLSA